MTSTVDERRRGRVADGAERLTKAQRDLLVQVARATSINDGVWRLRDMRRARTARALEDAGLLNYGIPYPGPWPRTLRIDLSLTDAGRAFLVADQSACSASDAAQVEGEGSREQSKSSIQPSPAKGE